MNRSVGLRALALLLAMGTSLFLAATAGQAAPIGPQVALRLLGPNADGRLQVETSWTYTGQSGDVASSEFELAVNGGPFQPVGTPRGAENPGWVTWRTDEGPVVAGNVYTARVRLLFRSGLMSSWSTASTEFFANRRPEVDARFVFDQATGRTVLKVGWTATDPPPGVAGSELQISSGDGSNFEHVGSPRGAINGGWEIWRTSAGPVDVADGYVARVRWRFDDGAFGPWSRSEPELASTILQNLPVSRSQLQVQMTPIDSHDGDVYIANIEPGPSPLNGGENNELLTVVRKGTEAADGSWSFEEKAVVEDHTAFDRYHTAPSVAVDQAGQIHVAYNMHNLPWQYKRSTVAGDLDSLVFAGTPISDAEIDLAVRQTNFPDLGDAAIPGNQITYPSFHKDRGGRLFVSYRFAARPGASSFERRMMSTGIARYSVATARWTALGGTVDIGADFDNTGHSSAPTRPTVLAGEQGWTSAQPRLMFDGDDRVFVSMFWIHGIASADMERPCFVEVQSDRTRTATGDDLGGFPVTPDDCAGEGSAAIGPWGVDRRFWTIGSSVMDAAGRPYIVVSPQQGERQIATYSPPSGWTLEPAPNGATELFLDGDDSLWAVANGPIVSKLLATGRWLEVYRHADGDHCYPQVAIDGTETTAYLHTLRCPRDGFEGGSRGEDSISVIKIRIG